MPCRLLKAKRLLASLRVFNICFLASVQAAWVARALGPVTLAAHEGAAHQSTFCTPSFRKSLEQGAERADRSRVTPFNVSLPMMSSILAGHLGV